ncbi:MAG: AAA family ATPase [Balneolaceae bacterium]
MPWKTERLVKKKDKSQQIGKKSRFERGTEGDAGKKFYQSYKWIKFRKEKLQRDLKHDQTMANYWYQVMFKVSFKSFTEYLDSGKPLCVHCLDFGHLKPAQVLDHITRMKAGGGVFDESNLQWLCSYHHNRKSQKEGYMQQTKVTIVSGPPGSGKTTWVKEHHSSGDLVYDLDEIFKAISFQIKYDKPKQLTDLAFRIRDLMYRFIKEPNKIETAWIITTAPEADKRKELASMFGANLIRLAVDKEECLNRIEAQGRTNDKNWNQLVDEYFKLFQEIEGEEVIRT